MITLAVSNKYVALEGAGPKVIRKLEKATSYLVAGHYFSPSFRAKRWDGREHLLTYSKKHGYRAPRGLLEDIARELKRRKIQYRVRNDIEFTGKPLKLRWDPDVTPRPYQHEAVASVTTDLEGKPTIHGLGTLKMPIRSGKTKTAARVVWKLQRSAIFIVPSQMLLHQTKASLEECFLDQRIGRIGDSECDIQDITVATIQTLARWRGRRKQGDKLAIKTDPRYKDIIRRFDIMVPDEAHHIRGDGDWHKVFADFHSAHRIALSATVFPDNESEQEHGIIWLRATCGPIRIDIPMSQLVDDGYLLKQEVQILPVAKPNLRGKKWSQTLWHQGILANEYRNKKIALIARKLSKNMKVLIVCNRHVQINMLDEMLWDLSVEHDTLTGKHSAAHRKEVVENYVNGEFNVLLGTVLSEGVDIPAIESVINAEGGRDVKNTVQRMRNMTIAEGKARAVFIDFMDTMNEYFEEHSLERLKVYEAEDAFEVKVFS